ncbi:MAG: CHASE4 domain-containing protein [bacterium]
MQDKSFFGFLKIRTKFFLAFIALVILPVMVIPVYMYQKISGGILNIEIADAEESAIQYRQVRATENSQLLKNLQDYAHWDDAVNALNKSDGAWFKSQVFEYISKHYGYEMIIIADKKGKVLWQYGAPIELSDDISDTKFFRNARSGNETVVYEQYEKSAIMIASANIIPIAAEGSPTAVNDAVGVMVCGDKISVENLVNISVSIGHDVAFFNDNTLVASSEYTRTPEPGTLFRDVNSEAFRQISSKKQYTDIQPDYIYLYIPVISDEGGVIGAIRLSQERSWVDLIKRELYVFIWMYSIGLFASSIIFLVIMSFTVVGPISQIIKLIKNFNKDAGTSDPLMISRSDEFGDLYRTFHSLISQVSAHDKELTELVRALAKSKEENESKIAEITKLNKFMVGRELRMIELKKELKVCTESKQVEIKNGKPT